MNVRFTKNPVTCATESTCLSCETELENVRWHEKQVPIGKVKAIMYREYSSEERKIIDEFEELCVMTFKLSTLDYGAFKHNHEFPLPKHLKTIPQSLLHEVENKTLGDPDNPIDRSDATAVNEYIKKLKLSTKD